MQLFFKLKNKNIALKKTNMSASAYYSTQNGIGAPGNFGISNTIRIGVKGNVNNYNGGLNNAGLLPQNANVITTTNVVAGMIKNAKYVPQQDLALNVTNKALDAAAYNANQLNITSGPKIHLYPNETSVNTYQA